MSEYSYILYFSTMENVCQYLFNGTLVQPKKEQSQVTMSLENIKMSEASR